MIALITSTDVPKNPGVAQKIEVGPTTILSSNTLQIYTKKLWQWREWRNIKRAMKKNLVEAVPEILLYGYKVAARN